MSCSDEEFAAAVSEAGEWSKNWACEEERNKRRVLGLAREGGDGEVHGGRGEGEDA